MISQALLAARALSSASSDTLDSTCGGKDPGIACRLTWDILHNRNAAELVKVWLAQPVSVVLRIIFVLLIAVLVRFVAHRLINKITTRAAQVGGNGKADAAHVLLGERRRQRANALGSILRNAASVLIFGIAAVTIAGDLGLNLAPVLASAGVLGLAIGFGAQSLVRDFLAGIFMLLEDQYGVGDVINAGDATGTVEAVSLRVTRLARRQRRGLARAQRDHQPDRQRVTGLGPRGGRLPGGLRPGPARGAPDHEGHGRPDVAGAALA